MPNDIAGFLKKHPSISLLGFNGASAKVIFKRHNELPCGDVDLCQLPSTSPAYASMKKEQKLDVWLNAITPHISEPR